MYEPNVVFEIQDDIPVIALDPNTHSMQETEEVDRWYAWSYGKCKLYVLYSNGNMSTQVVDDSLCS